MNKLAEIVDRDLIGYGGNPPHALWPGGARLAVQVVLNYEEGGESCVLNGDDGSETFLSELHNPPSFPTRHLSMESIYEYGSRVGVWRILKAFRERNWPLTIFAVGLALEKHPDIARHFAEEGHEIAGHGYRWIHYQNIEENIERDHLSRCVEAIKLLTGKPPVGWYTGRDSPNTRRLLSDHGGFLYHSDYYGDDLPFYMGVRNTAGEPVKQLVIPYTLDNNDMRFSLPQGFKTGDDFFTYLRDAFDVLYAEGQDTPRMMSIGLHARLIGRPGRFGGLLKFLDHVKRHGDVWICRREDIARHWLKVHPGTK
ncbi:MAG: allantoinase PuuE [Burkholderiaceae bacterium]|jgi:putative urate catabolism protein